MKLWNLVISRNEVLFLPLYLRGKVPLRDQAAWKKFAPVSGSSSSIKIQFIYENKNISPAMSRHTLNGGFYSNGRI